MLITYLASGDEEVVACELSAFRFAMRSVRPRMHSFRGKWPAEWQTGPEHPTCQVVWRDEPLLLAPGCAEPFWIDAPLAAAVADASIRLMGRSDPLAVRVITVCGDQIVEHIIAVDPREPVLLRAAVSHDTTTRGPSNSSPARRSMCGGRSCSTPTTRRPPSRCSPCGWPGGSGPR